MNSNALSGFLVDRIGWLLIHSLWQYTLLALAMMVLLRLMRRRSAAARYWTCLAALAAIVVTPTVTWTFLPASSPQPEAASDAISPAIFRAAGGVRGLFFEDSSRLSVFSCHTRCVFRG